MQSSWLFFPHQGLRVGYPWISAAESHPPYTYTSERLLGLNFFLDNVINHASQFHVPGSVSHGGALASLSQRKGGFLFWLMKSRNTGPVAACTKSECSQEFICRHCDCPHKNHTAFDIGKGNVQGPRVSSICKSGALAVILARITSVIAGNQWTWNQNSPFVHLLMLAGAFVPPLDNLSSKLLPIPVEDTTEQITKDSHGYVQGHCAIEHPEEWNMLYLTNNSNGKFRDVVEPRTGINFPTSLFNTECESGNTSLISQVLVGVGSRDKTFAKVKSVKIYAFGLYVRPDSVCNKLGQRYSDVPPEELKNRPEFFEDLLRQDMWMTVRLVVHFKGLKIGMVRNVFESALRKRLKKIKGSTDDDGLIAFCDYFSKDISLPPGTTIDFHRLPGGRLRTEVGGEKLGTICSRDLCRAFFDLYVGETPMSLKAKQDIGENIGRVIRKC